MQSKLLNNLQQMYDESSQYWSSTRQKKYRETGTANWPVIQQQLDNLKTGGSILDVGCGNGRLISGIKPNIKYVGIDFSKGLLNEAKKLYPAYDFRFADITEDSMWNELPKFDAVFSIAVLHHIPERDQQLFVVKAIKEHIKSEGKLVLSVWNLWQEKFLQYHLDSAQLKKVNKRWVEVPFQNKWKRFCFQMDIPYLMELMHESGFEVEEIFFADRQGNKADILTGENLVVIARS